MVAATATGAPSLSPYPASHAPLETIYCTTAAWIGEMIRVTLGTGSLSALLRVTAENLRIVLIGIIWHSVFSCRQP